ncbi:MAG: TonB-dependent receptor [Caulobacterales bacterium 68-7]|nr:TonB-dependent receptor [Caulobacterales bacterium]OJU08895.1 MAG: TonB-dependent receptor [Caulobacterales bacterium 68-7]
MKKSALFGLVALTPMLLATAAAAQEAIATAAPEPVAEVVVQTSIGYRNRTEAVAPVLEYGSDYFQRFEPLTAGDAMKRVPSVTFLSDVLESDGARLRGLDPGYTQILINGEKVPGANADRSFFVDRIPAELIDHIEVVRSASANRSGDAIAGALNIVLRDAMAIDGGYLRAGGILLNDGRVRETLGGVWGGAAGPGRLLVGASLQGRRNPKEKTSWRYDEPGASLNNIEDQTDTRNGTDYSFNADYSQELGGGDLNLSGFWVRTDRLQNEDSLEYDEGVRTTSKLNLYNNNDVDILTDNWSLNGRYAHDMFGGKTTFRLGYAKITDEQNEFEDETEFDRTPNRFTHDRTLTNLEDSETTARLSHQRDVTLGKLELGLEYRKKQRDTLIGEIPRIRYNLPNANPPAEGPASAVSGGDSSIEETRLDPYVMLSGSAGAVKWEAGVRYETTDVSIADRTVGANSYDTDYAEVLPSAHLRWSLSSVDRVTASVARTVRRPAFTETSPALLEEEMGDNDLVGNPQLKPEKAWGFDLGYERRLGRQGVAGVNAFYRDVTDRIELASIGTGSAGAPARLMQPQNIGDGAVWGLEFDLSTPLTAFGLENTGVFLNYSWLDSDVNDVFGSRKFNSQSDFVFNTGFIQDLPSLGAAFGVTYRKQGDAFGRVIGEEVTTRYGGDLEIFVEKRLANKVTIRLTGSNLLNGKKQETFDKFASTADQIARDYDEYERESEEAGPVFQLIVRAAF